MRTAVVVPLYKRELTSNETVSLRQCLSIFQNQNICFVLPADLSPEYLPTAEPFRLERFPVDFFRSLTDYNRLMLSIDFYRRFDDLDYILIYQLDSYVFRDELQYWCDRGFDYIGAPWVDGDGLRFAAGNGGFSLRKIDSFMSVLSRDRKRLDRLGGLIARYPTIPRVIYNLPDIVSRYYSKDNIVATYLGNPTFNEDFFYAAYGPSLDKSFMVASPMESIPFSFEVEPVKLFDLNNRRLPFGCHAFEKHAPDFWMRFIPFTRGLA